MPEQRMMMFVERELPAQKLPPLAGQTNELVVLLLLMGARSVAGPDLCGTPDFGTTETLQADLSTAQSYRCC